ncbi:Pentatricopeptide repeat-containing protein [Thalictrum thalictroides]|uniref:Pentatricopeptide repeat-containing protein n=1 Tax=Thalictrum thalictroides TaxID=46969 RepID=A0A7J6UZ07_THATH|nr:Pentatricopeptide repeat-containing protein [Thalictrum thalictroides]
MITQGVLPDPHTYSTLMDAMCKIGMVEQAQELLEAMIASGLKPDIVTYNVFIDGYCLQGQIDCARRFFYSIVAKGHEPNVISYSIMFEEMVQKGITLDDLTFNIIVQAFLKSNDIHKALQYLNTMDERAILRHAKTVSIIMHMLADDYPNHESRDRLRNYFLK